MKQYLKEIKKIIKHLENVKKNITIVSSVAASSLIVIVASVMILKFNKN